MKMGCQDSKMMFILLHDNYCSPKIVPMQFSLHNCVRNPNSQTIFRFFIKITILENFKNKNFKKIWKFWNNLPSSLVSGRSNPVQISRFYLVLVFFCSSLARCCVFKNSFVENFQNFLLGVNFFPKNFPGKCFVCCFAINRRLLLLEFVSIGSRISFPPVSRSLCEFLSSLAPSLSHVFFPSESTKMKKRGSPLLQNEKLDSMAPRVVKK